MLLHDAHSVHDNSKTLDILHHYLARSWLERRVKVGKKSWYGRKHGRRLTLFLLIQKIQSRIYPSRTDHSRARGAKPIVYRQTSHSIFYPATFAEWFYILVPANQWKIDSQFIDQDAAIEDIPVQARLHVARIWIIITSGFLSQLSL